MRIFLDFIRGIAIGMSNVIPGFSGGTMALILGVYHRFIEAISDFFSHPLESIKKIGILVIGIIVGIVGAIFLIVKMLELAPFITIMFFIGLIFGSLPFIAPSFKEYKIKVIDIITFIVCLALIVIFPLLNRNSSNHSLNVVEALIIIVMGMISAGAMVVPGVSGSMILMALGYYTFIIGSLKDFMSGLIELSFKGNEFIILIVFAIGILLGLVFISKLIKYLFSKYPKTVKIGICGLLIASPFAIIYSSSIEYGIDFTNAWIYPLGFVTLVIGAISSFMISKKGAH